MISDESYQAAAVIFLRRELQSGSLEQVCSQHRWVGGTGYIENEIVDVTLGNSIGTSPENPGKNIVVTVSGKGSRKFMVEDIYKLIEKSDGKSN